eukprot:259005-Amphidinium_carterae.1
MHAHTDTYCSTLTTYLDQSKGGSSVKIVTSIIRTLESWTAYQEDGNNDYAVTTVKVKPLEP